MFLATSQDGWERLRGRAAMQRSLGVPVEEVAPSRVRGLRVDDVAGAVACWEDGVAEPAAVTAELVRRAAELGVDVLEQTDARQLSHDVLVVACGAASTELLPELPVRPLCRQLVDVGPISELPADLPM